MRKIPTWLPSLHEPGPPRLWRIGYALTACFVIAVAGLAALWAAAMVLLHHPALPRSHAISVHDTVGVAQLVFASVAGAGALVALVVAYRRQRVSEAAAVLDKERVALDKEHWQATAAHDRTRLLNERFTTIASQLGEDKPAVRLAGVHAMAGLADDWEENRQPCVDVLCAYLRLPNAPDPGDDAAPDIRAVYRANREVRHTIIRLISDHLRPGAAVSWQGLNLDFTDVAFDSADFSGAEFSGGIVRFTGASFASGTVDFGGAKFSRGEVHFGNARFSGGEVNFSGAVFSGGTVYFRGSEFSGGTVDFGGARFFGGEVNFSGAVFSGGTVYFRGAVFSGGGVYFSGAVFSGATVDFGAATFSGATVDFGGTRFFGGEVRFGGAMFSVGTVYFNGAVFSGAMVDFDHAAFVGGTVDFHGASEWSQPPKFNWRGTPPTGVVLPASADATPN